MQFLWFLFFLQVLVQLMIMVLVPDQVPVPVLDQTWSWSLVPVLVPSYFWSRPWTRSRHISGPGLGPGPGPGQNFWSRHIVPIT